MSRQYGKPPCHRSGYTLVELSIVIIIVSLLTATGLTVGTSMIERAAYIDSQKLIAQIQQSLKDYYIVFGRLPCVASLNDSPGSASFGEEIVNCTTAGNPAAGSGTFRETVGAEHVRVGMVPVRTLGLPDSAAQDKFGSRIIYAITENFTDAGTFGAATGAITVYDVANNPILNDSVYFLASHGRDRKGGYAYQTGNIPIACGTTDNRDVLNCELDSFEFRDAPFNNGDIETQFFDDLTAWAPKFHFMSYDTESSSLWASQVGSDNIFAVGPDGIMPTGNVGIGTQNPTSKLGVVGNITVQGVYDATGTGIVGISYRRTDARDARIMVGDPTQRWSIASGWNTAGDFSLVQEGIAGDRLYVKQNGNVGIGTVNPLERLSVNGNLQTNVGFLGVGGHGSTYMHLSHANLKGAGQYALLQDGTSGHTFLNSVGAGNIYVRHNNVDQMLIRSDGAVGIGTTAPAAKLDVKGGYIHATPYCREIAVQGPNAAHVYCAANEYVLNGGGWCTSPTTSAIHLNRAWGNGWAVDCWPYAGGADTPAVAYVRCCRG